MTSPPKTDPPSAHRSAARTRSGRNRPSHTPSRIPTDDSRRHGPFAVADPKEVKLLKLNPGDVPGGSDYLDQVREEEAYLEENGNTIDEVLEALEAGSSSD